MRAEITTREDRLMACCHDCLHWGLTPAQSVRYHLRLSRYHSGRAQRHAVASIRWLYVSLAAQVIALIGVVIALALP